MGWTRLPHCSVGLALSVLLIGGGCGGNGTSANSAGSAGTSETPTGSAGAAAGSTGAGASSGGHAASSAGHDSGGSAANSGASATGGSGVEPETVNWYVDELRGREGCLPRPLPVVEASGGGFEAGQARCHIVLATAPPEAGACACDSADDLTKPSASLTQAVANRAQQIGTCGGASGVDCQKLCVCELGQCSGAALSQCQTDTTPTAELPPGFCYVDATIVPPLGNAALVASCPQESRRELRLLGPAPEPAPLMFLGCASTPLDSP